MTTKSFKIVSEADAAILKKYGHDIRKVVIVEYHDHTVTTSNNRSIVSKRKKVPNDVLVFTSAELPELAHKRASSGGYVTLPKMRDLDSIKSKGPDKRWSRIDLIDEVYGLSHGGRKPENRASGNKMINRVIDLGGLKIVAQGPSI